MYGSRVERIDVAVIGAGVTGLGVRAAGTVLGFQACLEIITGAGTVSYVAAVRRADLLVFARKHGGLGVLAGVISVLGFLAYLAAAQRLPDSK